MSLPGKLCIGVLEEDNPLKAYFRFKPLLVEAEGRYQPYDGTYPEEGCIRVVPDKNESYHFKARMRQLGLFCEVDLRAHPDDNDKIRPNKNYREGSPEKNAFILYSDVVKAPAPDSIFEVLASVPSEGAVLAAPRTAAVLPEAAPGAPLLRCEPAGTEGLSTLASTDRTLPEDAQFFDLPTFGGARVHFAILPPKPAPARTPAAPKPALYGTPSPAAPKPSPMGPVALAEQMTDEVASAPTPAPKPFPSSEGSAPAPDETPSSPSPVSQALPSSEGGAPTPDEVASAPTPATSAPTPDAKPWIHHDSSIMPRPVDPRLSPAQRSLAMQSGMNPRRGRSLQELIDEKWQRSRLSQLGQSIGPIHTEAPVANPVEGAVDAVRRVWEDPGLREDLLKSLGELEDFGPSLEACREAARQSGIERHLDALEARRLSLLSELDHLNLKNADVRRELKKQLLTEKDAEIDDATRRADAARAERQACEARADEARAAARDARAALDTLTTETLEQRLADFALNQHMVQRMALIKAEAEAEPPAMPPLQTLDLNALAVRVMNRFDASGFAITRAEALNLCACAAISPVLILSGPVGSGKTETARMLIESLGWTAHNRCAAFEPGSGPLKDDDRLKALAALPQAPAVLLLDDANLYPGPDPLRGLDMALQPRWRLVLTVQDGGCPLPARALDRGFTLRLRPKPATPWRPRPKAACAPEAPAVLNLTIPDNPLPAAAEERMARLRDGLHRHGAMPSRRALDDAWRYCALMLSALGENADPVAVLDRAVAQRLLPALLASAPAPALASLPRLLDGLPISLSLLTQPVPVEVD